MTRYSKLNVIYRLQKWMDSVPGQTFLNYAYSWGASIVILGTLFKLTHLKGANLMLFIGMGTEVFVFFLSAFDRPFDKTAIGMDLPTHLGEEDEDEEHAGEPVEEQPVAAAAAVSPQPTVIVTGQPVVGVNQPYSGGTSAETPQPTPQPTEATTPSQPTTADQPTTTGQPVGAPTTIIAGGVGQPSWVAEQGEQTPELAEAQTNYVDALNTLVETLGKVNEQSERLTRDSEEMENLNRTLTGITKIYEMQLKAASQQVGTIDEINEQTRKMAQQIDQLNKIYARMIEAMTVNMRAANAGAEHV